MPLSPRTLPKKDPLIQGGANCPFCGFPFHPGDNVILCPSDNTPHHTACWQQNGNHCTTLGCLGSGEIAIPITAIATPTAAPASRFAPFAFGVFIALFVGGLLILGLIGMGVIKLGSTPPSTAAVFATQTKEIQIFNPTTVLPKVPATPTQSIAPTIAFPTFAPSPTSIPVPKGRIAFASKRDGNLQIYAMNDDGINLVRLTRNSASDGDPAWSPDGRLIAFTSDRDGNNEIYVMNADGTNQHNLTRNPKDDWFPAWSPDGRLIAFTSDRDGNENIHIMNADGTNVKRLTSNSADNGRPSWSLDGRLIAFHSAPGGNWDIYLMNLDGIITRRLTNDPAEDITPAWSPDGRFISFGSKRDGHWQVYVMNADGTNTHRLINDSADDLAPAWGPDSNAIVFESNRNGTNQLYAVNLDGLVFANLPVILLVPTNQHGGLLESEWDALIHIALKEYGFQDHLL